MSQILNALFNGLSVGSVLLIVALGLAIVFGLMGAINLAHGELMMLGAYTTFLVQNAMKPLGSPLFDLYIFVALPLAFLVAAIAGLILEKGVIRHLYGRPLETLLATWGVSLILIQTVRSISWTLTIVLGVLCLLYFGGKFVVQRFADWDRIQRWANPTLLSLSIAIALATGFLLSQVDSTALNREWFSARNVDVTAPAWLRGGILLGTVQLPYARLFIIVLTIFCTIGVYWFLNKSLWGLRIRAVTQNREMSACLGIPTERVDALTFALGSGLAGIAGCAVTLLGSVGPNLGSSYIVDAFMVVVVGGVGKLVGSIVAALVIGSFSYLIGSGTFLMVFGDIPSLAGFFEFFATTSMAKVMVFAAIVAFLQVKPAGMFPQKGRTIDA
ncbi:MAG: branched-chain amino acid ABC transporter permease [Oscillatoriales cyanobacterium]|nr:MAG: branched-chain amino acid ABC transporter permease [Oscillatoriales cyanobacterium]